MRKYIRKIFGKIILFPFFIILVFPASTNYSLRSYEFGGGGASMDSASYALEAILGQQTASMSSTNFNIRSGLSFVQDAYVPTAPGLVNSSNWYNKLLLTINISNNPTDTKYAVAITDDNWITIRYVQNDNTVGDTLGIEDYQTYANWGSGSGENIIGLTPNKTYKVKVKAMQGEFTETQYGPDTAASTSSPSISFDIDVSSTDTETAAPYTLAFGSLSAGSVNTASDKVWIDIATNGEAGGYVYISDTNNGLKSTALNYTIDSVTGDLASLSEGVGAQSSTDTEGSGGPLTPLSPFNGSSNNVGIINTTVRELYSTSGVPITGGRGSFVMKVKPGSTTPASNDYSDTLTIIASGTF